MDEMEKTKKKEARNKEEETRFRKQIEIQEEVDRSHTWTYTSLLHIGVYGKICVLKSGGKLGQNQESLNKIGIK